MAFTQISGSPPQYFKETINGGEGPSSPASGYYMKFYNSAIEPIAMASDKDGGGLLEKARLDSSGYPLNGSGNRFTPFIDQSYKIAFYQNADDADNNNTTAVDWFLGPYDQFQTGDAQNIQLDFVSDMTTESGPVDGRRVNLSDYANGNGAGSLVFITRVGTGTDDSGSVINHATLAFRYEQVFGQTISPKQFGAPGGEVTLDSLAFNNSLAYVALNNRPLSPTADTYLLRDVDTSGASIIGQGKRTILKESGSTGTFMLTESTTNKVDLSDLTLDGNNATSKSAIDYQSNLAVSLNNVNLINWEERIVFTQQGVTKVTVNGGEVSNNNGSDCYVIKSFYNILTGIQFDTCEDHVIRFGRFSADTDQASGHYSTVSNCIFKNVGNDAVLFELDSKWGMVSDCVLTNSRSLVKAEVSDPLGVVSNISVVNNQCETPINEVGACIKLDSAENSVVIGNTIDGWRDGISVGSDSIVSVNIIKNADNQSIDIDGSRVIITDNIISTSSDQGIDVQGDDCTIKGNIISACTNEGIRVALGSNHTITGNRIDACGISISVTSTSNDNQVKHNISTNATSNDLVNTGTGTVVESNIGIDDSIFDGDVSAGVITIGPGVLYANVDTESAAPTDDLDTINGGMTGKSLIIQSTGTVTRDVTLKDSTGNIRLAGGADFTLADTEDTISMVFDGTNWNETSRSDN